MQHFKKASDRWFRTSSGKVTLFQRPNAPIILAAVSTLAAWPATGRLGHALSMVAFGAFFVWAWLELTQGVNYFRRALGAAVLVLLILSSFR